MLIPFTQSYPLSLSTLFTILYETRIAAKLTDESDKDSDRNAHYEFSETYYLINNNLKEEYIEFLNGRISILSEAALANPEEEQQCALLIKLLTHYIDEIAASECLLESDFWDYRIYNVVPYDSKLYSNSEELLENSIGFNVIKRPTTITEEDIKGHSEEKFDNDFALNNIDDFDFGDGVVKPIGERIIKKPNTVSKKKEFKPWVIPLFAFAGLVLFGSLLYGYFN